MHAIYPSWRTSIYVLISLIGLPISAHNVLMHKVKWVPQLRSAVETPQPKLFKALTFGFQQISVDALFMEMLQDSNIAHKDATDHPAFYYTLDLSTTLDPRFFEAYYVSTTLLTIARRDYLGARHLLEKGIAFATTALSTHSEDFKKHFWSHLPDLYMMYGYLLAFEFQDLLGAKDAFSKASEFHTSHHLSKNLEAKLSSPEGFIEIGLRILASVERWSIDENSKKAIEHKKNEFLKAQMLLQWNKALYKACAENNITTCWKKFVQKLPIEYSLKNNLYLRENGILWLNQDFEPVLGVQFFFKKKYFQEGEKFE